VFLSIPMYLGCQGSESDLSTSERNALILTMAESFKIRPCS
jgi:hypothetical protein